MIKFKKVKMIDMRDWDRFVRETYGRPYSFQQQDCCRDRGTFNFTVPEKETYDDEMDDSIPEEINGEAMGVKFAKWLERDPEQPVGNETTDWSIELFWQRNFYPDINTLINDLHAKGLIEAGEYVIDINW